MHVQGTVLTSEVRLKMREAPLPCLWLEHCPTFGYRLPNRIKNSEPLLLPRSGAD